MSRLELAWPHLLHDNHRLMPILRGKRAVLITAPDYRKAKAEAELRFKAQWRDRMLEGDVRLHAKLWFPDLRKRDAANYRKLVTDALTGIAYSDDSQLVIETWEKAGLDRVHPRCELELTEIP